MSRAPALLLAALVVASSACGDSSSTGTVANLRQPSAIALFRGITLDAPTEVRPYLAVASASRDEIALLDARDDTPVLAPIQLRSLVVPIPDRPALLASASLGDGMADLLVVAAAGDSRVQLVRTWTVASDLDDAQVADLGSDVVALAAVPSPPGTARIAAALAESRLAVIDYARQGDAIVLSSVAVNPVPFQPVSLAAVPGDELHVYAATLDELAPGVFGVGEVDLSSPPGPWTVRALDARGPTRLVAAARLRERRSDSAEDDRTAFDETQAAVPRVYAVLDESGCGLGRRIDCGIAMLDLVLGRIPDDWAGRMPYRAPIRLPSRARALAISPPPVEPPSGDPGDAVYQDDFMRLYRGASSPLATTAVGAVATDGGNVYFLDLGRFKLASTASPLDQRSAGIPAASFVEVEISPGVVESHRLWIRKPAPDDTFPADGTEASQFVEVTPGYTPDGSWSVGWQGALPSLVQRAAEAGRTAPGSPWIALQVGEGPAAGPRILSQVVRVYHPNLGVRVGDIAVLRALEIEGCGKGDSSQEFEATIVGLLEPSAPYPGGALALLNDPATDDCVDRLEEAVAAGNGIATKLEVTVRAGALLLTGGVVGYAGRPQLDQRYALEYPSTPGGEDALAAVCPLADWDGSLPAPACTGACTREACEELVLARKARRVHHLAEGCGADADCIARWPGFTFPIVNGPAIAFRVGVQAEGGGTALGPPTRGESLSLDPTAGFTPLSVRPASGSPVHPNGAVAFDRSPDSASAGYRFFVSYPADFVLDASPSVSPVEAKVVR